MEARNSAIVTPHHSLIILEIRIAPSGSEEPLSFPTPPGPGMEQPLPIESVYGFLALLVVFCAWSVFYLFFSARLLGIAVSFLLNTFVLRGESAIQIRAIHFALLRGMIVIRDVTYTTPNISLKMVDCVLSMAWWRTWAKHPALLHITSRGLEYYIINNGARYEDLETILKRREEDAVEQHVQVGLDAPPDAPLLFWLTKALVINLSVGCVIIGNPSLPTALVVSFEKARGTASLVDTAPSAGIQRVQADLDLHSCTVQIRENKGWTNESDDDEGEKRSVWQTMETWQYWESLAALKEGLVAPLNFLRVGRCHTVCAGLRLVLQQACIGHTSACLLRPTQHAVMRQSCTRWSY